MNSRLLEGKSAVITGAGSGVGRQAAFLFAQNGAKVTCADIREDWIEGTVSEIRSAGGEAQGALCDVTRRADVEGAVAKAVETYGRLDIIYNNAGIASPMTKEGGFKSFVEADDDDIDRLLAVNVKGVILGCQVAIAQFRAQGGGGVIVNTASVAGMIGWGGALYGATKGAVVNLTRTLAIEVSGQGIRVNSVCPAGMLTHYAGLDPDSPHKDKILEGMGKAHPLGRAIEPGDTATAAMFLASDLASNITGVNLPVDGGLTAGRKIGG